ncbi:MAG: tRNA glutamyl-Q(34) synthetase GluQRS [Desulfovibrio sp.]|nr:tRNA glutamyl-Q(34) synthetase GluQRS [Desulfovibrio sp.]
MTKDITVTGRLAPSPTGLLHLGNAWAFLLAWLACRAQKGRLILRIEDIDPQRSRPEFVTAILEDLRWLGLDWDEGPDLGGEHGPYVQSQRLAEYAYAIEQLSQQGHVYPCFCTRKELKSLANAPHLEDTGPVYPGTCRNLSEKIRQERMAQGLHYTLRFACAEPFVDFVDAVCGPQHLLAKDWGGDFALRRSDGVISYQLAVALDDALMGVTQVVRGRDILFSTPKQILLLRRLGKKAPSQYAHIPLLLNAQGERLAKRHQSLTLAALRCRGVQPERLIGLLSFLAGLNPHAEAIRAKDLLADFAFSLLPKADVCLDGRRLESL